MLLTDFFKRYNVHCPEWLANEFLEEKWVDSEYSMENHIHKWVLKNTMQDLCITFDGETYCFRAFDDEGTILFRQMITEEMCLVT